MRYFAKKQQGMTAGGIVLMLIGICMSVVIALKIIPVYMQQGKVKSALESMANIPEIENKSKREVNTFLYKRFDVNGIRNLPKDAVKITKFGGYLKIKIKYDTEEQLVSNLFVLIKFDEEIEVGSK
ncbi:MAG: DUF4845 domain-containing protein [Methylococcaceae bacterium]|nr:DUF4845 domain-containing protein [Methylococcaceae bacterium]